MNNTRELSGNCTGYAIVKTRFSMGDVISDEIIGVFDSDFEAAEFLEDYLIGIDKGFKWAGWDEYEVREIRNQQVQATGSNPTGPVWRDTKMGSGLIRKVSEYLNFLCEQITCRTVGSNGNQRATGFFQDVMRRFEWKTATMDFEAMDWLDGGAMLCCGDTFLDVRVGPYSLGCDTQAILVPIATIDELESADIAGKIVLLHGAIASEQLMPKNFVFYNPDEHQKIIAWLEDKQPVAIVAATGRNAALAGGVYPFPLIEDGDFDIPSVYMTEEEGERLLRFAGQQVGLTSHSTRIPSKGCNVVATKGMNDSFRIVVTAHIDSKNGTSGAIDNATGVVVLMLLAELLADYDGERTIEIVALNGEDYYAAPGQMQYLNLNMGRFDQIMLNINIDGAGSREGKSAFSMFGLPDNIMRQIETVMLEHNDIVEGALWPQGDHGIFNQQGCPAIAVSSKWFIDHINEQDITHTPKDHIDIVDFRKVVDIALAINGLIRALVV